MSYVNDHALYGIGAISEDAKKSIASLALHYAQYGDRSSAVEAARQISVLSPADQQDVFTRLASVNWGTLATKMSNAEVISAIRTELGFVKMGQPQPFSVGKYVLGLGIGLGILWAVRKVRS